MFISTLDKIAWILFNRKISMNKSLQSPLRQGFHGIGNKLPHKKFHLPSEHANKSPVTGPKQVPLFSSLDWRIKTKKTVHTSSYLSSALPLEVRYGFKLTLFPGEAWGTELQHASPKVRVFSAIEAWLLMHSVVLRAPFQKALKFFSLNCSAQ